MTTALASRRQLAALHRISVTTVQRILHQQGAPQAVRFTAGGATVYSTEAFARFLSERPIIKPEEIRKRTEAATAQLAHLRAEAAARGSVYRRAGSVAKKKKTRQAAAARDRRTSTSASRLT